LAWQQAALAAAAQIQGRGVVELLADEYGLASPGHSTTNVRLFLEISDFAATAERVERMLALRPGGVGYRLTGGRVAESIGEGGQHLQRFVRDLGRRMDSVYGEGDSRPAIYLGLNGALGQLAGDPVRTSAKSWATASGCRWLPALINSFSKSQSFWTTRWLNRST
jgi:methylaspartate ammonia-lyase